MIKMTVTEEKVEVQAEGSPLTIQSEICEGIEGVLRDIAEKTNTSYLEILKTTFEAMMLKDMIFGPKE